MIDSDPIKAYIIAYEIRMRDGYVPNEKEIKAWFKKIDGGIGKFQTAAYAQGYKDGAVEAMRQIRAIRTNKDPFQEA